MKKVLAFFVLTMISTNLFCQTAIELNKTGMAFYKNKDYFSAIGFFRKAIIKDNNLIEAHYNLACTLSLAMSNSTLEYTNKYREYFKIERPVSIEYEFRIEAEKELEKTFQLDQRYKVKALSDSDLDNLRKYIKYYQLLGYSMNSLNDLFEILTNIEMWTYPGEGTYAYFASAKFNKNLTFKLSFLNYKTNGFENANGNFTIFKENNKLTIVLIIVNQGKAKTYKGQINNNNAIEIDNNFWSDLNVYIVPDKKPVLIPGIEGAPFSG